MKKIFKIFKKKPLIGNKISHSNKKNKRYFNTNLKKKKIFIRNDNFFLKIKLNVKKINSINKYNNYYNKWKIKK